ncbi:MAG: DUF4157 domain-containing protein [Chloroflexi bacterium]|nr:DUF4157 domain-containing protein [Chloroflexota bacterium]
MTGKTKDTDHEQVQPMQQETVKQSPQKSPVPEPVARSRAQVMRQMQHTLGNARINRMVARDKRTDPGEASQVGHETQAALTESGRGQPLPEPTRVSMEKALGSDLKDVRVHTDPQADRANRELNANAFASGQDVYFAQGRYQPDQPEGKHLIAHELAHTVQQKDAPVARETADEPVHKQSTNAEKPAGDVQTAPQVSKPGDRVEREAESAAQQISAGKQVAPGTISRMRPEDQHPARQTADVERAAAQDAPVQRTAPDEEPTAPAIHRAPAAGGAPTAATGADAPPAQAGAGSKGVSLASPTFVVPPGLDPGNSKKTVPVYFGKLASGEIEIAKQGDKYNTPRKQQIQLNHPALDPIRAAKVEPVLAVEVKDSAISGYITVSMDGKPAPNPEALMAQIKAHSREFGWAGIDVTKLPDVKGGLKDGTLTFEVENFPITLGGFIDGTANFSLNNEQVTFSGQANINIPGLGGGTLDLKRDEKGVIAGKTELEVALAKFSGKLNANFVGGVADIQGTVGYKDEKFSGEVTVLLVDEKTADTLATTKLAADKIQAKSDEMKAPAEDDGLPKPGKRKLAGFGTLEFALTDWMAGTATVIIDGKGHITVIGKIAPPAEKELFAQQDYSKQLVKVEIRAPYGIPVVGNVFLFANIALIAEARIGPAKIYKIEIDGTYSTNPDVMQNLQLAASFNMSAYAGLKLRGEGGVGLEILDHAIKAGAGINAIAGVKGYVDARPTIGYREKADPKEGKKGEMFIKGHAELAAQPFLALGGDLFVEVDSPWWSPLPDKKWTWPLGQLEYPLPGQFGIGADIDYVLGSKEYPQVTFSEAKFDSEKFMTDIMREKAPPKSGKENLEKPADFKENGDAKGVQQGGGGAAKGGGTKPGASADPGPAKPTVQPGGGKKDKKAPTDPKAQTDGDKKKKEALQGGKGKPSDKDVKDAKQKEDPKVKAEKEHDEKLKEGLAALDGISNKVQEEGTTKKELEAEVAEVKKQHKVFKSIQVVDGGSDWDFKYIASDGKHDGPQKAKAIPPKKDGKDYARILKGKLLDLSDFSNPVGQQFPARTLDPKYVSSKDKNGRTNSQRASKGLTSFLPNDDFIELHHTDQDFFSPLDEHSHAFHQSVVDDPEYHPFAGDPGYQSWRGEVAQYKGKIRSLGDIYNLIRAKYWRRRYK